MTAHFTKVEITQENNNRVAFELFTNHYDCANTIELLNDITLWGSDRYSNKPCTVWATEISGGGFILNTYCDWYTELLEDYGLLLTREYTNNLGYKVSIYETEY